MRNVVQDTTVEALVPLLMDNPRGLLLARDELNGWFGSFDRYASGKGGADEAHWLSMHSGNSFVVDRKTSDRTTLRVPRAFVSITGGIQPKILQRVLGTKHIESGLAARILFTNPPRKRKRLPKAKISPDLLPINMSSLPSLFQSPLVIEEKRIFPPKLYIFKKLRLANQS